MIIELTDIEVKPESIDLFIGKLSEFIEILLSLPGGLSARCLQDEAAPHKFAFLTEWESMEAKQLFLDDARLQHWAADYATLVNEQSDRYFQEHR